MTLQFGTLLQNRYRIIQQIGGGGMGMVYLAEDTRLAGRRCAVKEMSPDNLAPQDRNWAVQSFQREAQILANLHHPGLTAVTDFFPEQGNWYLVMDYVEGETLEEYLQRSPGGRLPVEEALRIVRQLMNVLEYLHSQNPPVIFRDMKPGNVMLTPQGDVKLIDFGIARFFKPGQTQDTTLLGTPGYAAPEQFGGRGQCDARTDVYGLGALLHRIITGYDPTQAVSPFPLPPIGSLLRGLPEHVESAVTRATQLDPALRFQNVGEFRQALFPPTRVLPPQPNAGRQPYTPTVPFPQAPAAPTRGKGVGIGLGIAALLLVGMCVVLAVIVPGLNRARQTITSPSSSSSSGHTPVYQTPVPTQPRASPPTSTPKPMSMSSSPTPTARPQPASPALRIAYVNGSVGSTDIYVAEADGSGRVCVACQSCDEAEPAWSPDGRYIVYQADCSGSYDIWVVSSGGGPANRLTTTANTDEREPDWSPDGLQIVFRVSSTSSDRNADGTLTLMNADGSNVRSLGVQGRSPVWSPNGQQIAFMSERSGSWEIYVYNLRDATTTRLTNCDSNCRWPAWSPDGRYVAYHSTTGAGSVTADTIWYIPASGGTPVQLVSGSHAGRPSWSSSGLIVFNSDRGIEVVREDGSGRQTLISSDQNWAPVWSR